MKKPRLDWTYYKYKYFTRWGAAHTYDSKVDMWYFYVGAASKKSAKTIETQANVDFDEHGNIIGIELYGWDKEDDS